MSLGGRAAGGESDKNHHQEQGWSQLSGGPRVGSRIAVALRILVVLAILPVFLLLVYSPPFVRPVSTLMVKDYALLQGVNRQWVDIENIAPVLVNSVMMAEDGQFCSHGGVDWHQLGLVLDDVETGARAVGHPPSPCRW